MNTIVKPNQERAKGVIVLLWIMIVLEVLMFISDYMEYSLFQRYVSGEILSQAEISNNELRKGLVSILYLIGIIISAVFFINWFRRAYNNLYLLGVPRLKYDEASAAWSWFVPFLNFIRPYQIMKDTWLSTNDVLYRYTNYQHNFKINIVNLWWALWIIQGVLSSIGSNIYGAEDINAVMTGSMLGMISNFLGTIAAFTAIKMIKEYSQMEEVLFQNQSNLHHTFTGGNSATNTIY